MEGSLEAFFTKVNAHDVNFYLFSKELFLVPDYRIKDITGASFAGFYYICFQKSTGSIEGYYYHKSSEMYINQV
jgi:hypothetical protein